MSTPAPELRGGPVRVLVADDAHDSRQLLGRMLGQAGFHVLDVRTGDAAVDVFRDQRPALTFLDIDMPGMDGLAAMVAIRAMDPGAQVVIVSGKSSLANVQQAMQLGALGFVVKPYSARRIIEVLRRGAEVTGDARLMPG